MTSSRSRLRTGADGTASLPSDGRAHNLALVLRTLHAAGAMSRANLSRALGLTRVTISDLVTELIARGHAVELGPSDEVRPGKPSILVDINRRGRQIVGLDLTENNILHAAVMDLDGRILARSERAITTENGEELTALVAELAVTAVGMATAPLLGVGVGTPGVVNNDGVVITAPNLGWTDVPLGAIIAEATGLQTVVNNDADAALHGEYTFGHGSDDMILVRVGRGVGSSLMVGGVRARGVHHAAGEIGHVTVGTDGGAMCRCGRTGCLETWLSVPALESSLAAAALAADSGEAARDVMRVAGERLAISLAPIVAAIDVEEIVLCGPAALLDGTLIDSVRETLALRVLPVIPPPTSVRLAHEPENTVLRGTAVMVMSSQLGVE
ncbi:putative NBD/HSP70 family sugar kinase [Arthrobacter stackebrandtii]|uniref:NBD/HSP70 family sugar kinase n=1 Tax=Arthrobacter stackebrandtii TaxID=272161 RepID=A0ABS4YRN5_9MICC|nr:ROK family transcriptional regulator [Arthrobacter stackebrandtii]MBP2411424.1 putative NBD/HSP70 family sugar kinase [Arthrobacter stackebrandtii]PYH00291.1 sugar kinase [Arthrobacter stackebrandtii]